MIYSKAAFVGCGNVTVLRRARALLDRSTHYPGMKKDMAVEIERKFLVRDESWRGLFTRQLEIRDGLIAVANGRKVRVRICDQQATLAVKARTEGLANAEFEYEIPKAEAEELIAHHCLRAELAKTRYLVPHGQLTWHVDVYKGILSGVILAEVGLPAEMAEIALPVWVGREVTGNPDYKKSNMVNARMGSASSVV